MHISCDGKNKTKQNKVTETKWHNRWQRTYFEKEIEPQERAAGDDGEPGSVPAGDRLRHVRGVLEQIKKGTVIRGAVLASRRWSSLICPSTSSWPQALAAWSPLPIAGEMLHLPFCHWGHVDPESARGADLERWARAEAVTACNNWEKTLETVQQGSPRPHENHSQFPYGLATR